LRISSSVGQLISVPLTMMAQLDELEKELAKCIQERLLPGFEKV
jgi:hypothetical protein